MENGEEMSRAVCPSVQSSQPRVGNHLAGRRMLLKVIYFPRKGPTAETRVISSNYETWYYSDTYHDSGVPYVRGIRPGSFKNDLGSLIHEGLDRAIIIILAKIAQDWNT